MFGVLHLLDRDGGVGFAECESDERVLYGRYRIQIYTPQKIPHNHGLWD
jgi:hypothetical protein